MAINLYPPPTRRKPPLFARADHNIIIANVDVVSKKATANDDDSNNLSIFIVQKDKLRLN